MVFLVAVTFFHGQFIVQIPFRISREVALIRKGFIADPLDLGILCRVNLQSAAVEQCVGLSLIVAGGNQIFQDIVRQCIHKVCINCGIYIFGICDLDTGVYVVSYGFVILLLCDVSLLFHVTQHFFAPFCIFIGVGDGIVFGRILGDTCDHGTFRQVQVADGFVEIAHGCSLYAQCILAQIDGVHVIDQDRIFVHDLFQFQSQILFLNLTF